MSRFLLLYALFLLPLGCAGISFDHKPVFHSPLVDTDVQKRSPTAGEGIGPKAPSVNTFRQAALDFGNALLARRERRADFGEADVSMLLEHLRVRHTWSPKAGVAGLAREARRQKAYGADGRPLPGDIVLFHNQRDLNNNGEIDDWLTGCGIVIRSDGSRFEAVIRTGNAPRRVIVTPLSPSVRVEDGEVINSFVRIPSRQDPKGTEYLAGQLYAGHIDIEKLPLR